MIIDSHAHFVPQPLLDEIAASRDFPSVTVDDSGARPRISFSGGKPTRPVSPGLSDLQGRLDWMDTNGIDMQVAGGWVDMFGYDLPEEEAVRWAAMTNRHLAEAEADCARLRTLGTVPLAHGAAAGEMLRDLRGEGRPGIMISSLPAGPGSVLDTPDLDPFWQAAHDTEAVVHIHPSFDAGDSRVGDFGLANAVGRITDAMIAVSRLVASGHVAKYKRAKIVVPMGAAGLPFVLGRLARNHQLHPELGDPTDALNAIYIDTILHDVRALKFVAEVAGVDRLLMGSDMPFPIGDMTPLKIVEEAGFDADTVARINGGLAAELFGIAR